MVQDDELTHSYRLSLRACRWVVLVGKLRQASQAKDRPEGLAIAATVMQEATTETRQIRSLDEWRLTTMRNKGIIVEDFDPSSPFPMSYTFLDPTAAQSFAYYAAALIGINRIAAMALNIVGLEDSIIELANVQMSHRIGGCIRYIRDLKPLGCCGFIHPLQLAFESCDTKQQQFIIDAFYEFEEYRGLPPGRWTERRILRYAKALTGRIPPAEALEEEVKFETGAAI